jgi:hypothetical protein
MESTIKGRPTWMWGALLVGIGLVFMSGQLFVPWFTDNLIGSVITGGIGASFLAVYLNDRIHWWALIPAYIMLSVAAVIFIGGILGNSALALLPFLAAAPFFYVYTRDHQHWWALIPGYFWAAIGAAAMLAVIFGENILGVVIPLLIALPFLYVYMNDRRHWWALIPGGIMLSIAVGVALAGLIQIIPIVMIGAGIALLAGRFVGSKSASREPVQEAPFNEFEPIMERRKAESIPGNGPEADR